LARQSLYIHQRATLTIKIKNAEPQLRPITKITRPEDGDATNDNNKGAPDKCFECASVLTTIIRKWQGMPIQNTCPRTPGKTIIKTPEIKAALTPSDAAFCLFGIH